MKSILTLIPAVALCLAGSASAQSGVLDQSETHDNVMYNMEFFNDTQQDIQVGIDGTLEGFKIRMSTQDIANGLPVAIGLGTGPHTWASAAWTGTAHATQAGNWEWVFVDCSAANLVFNVGDFYTIMIGDQATFSPGVSLTLNQGWPVAFYPWGFYEDQFLQGLTRHTFETFMLIDPPVLAATGTCGASMTFDVSSGTGNYWLVYGSAGSSTVRGIDLAISNPALATTMGASLTVNVPAGACGLTLQAIDMVNMIASNPIVL